MNEKRSWLFLSAGLIIIFLMVGCTIDNKSTVKNKERTQQADSNTETNVKSEEKIVEPKEDTSQSSSNSEK